MAKILDINGNESRGAAQKVQETQNAAIEKANREAGYDIALAFAALNTLRVNEMLHVDVPLAEVQADVVTMADIVNRATGGVMKPDVVAMLMEACIAYGWHWCVANESLLSSKDAKIDVMKWIDGKKELSDEQKAKRKDGVTLGLKAVADAVAANKKKMQLGREMKR